MKLDSYQQKSSTWSELPTLNWPIKPYIDRSQQQFQPSTWVQLLELPNPFCSDTALLLCQESEDQWLCWIPDYGEIKLYTHQFCQAG